MWHVSSDNTYVPIGDIHVSTDCDSVLLDNFYVPMSINYAPVDGVQSGYVPA